jgi:hypothetical protein
VVTVVELVLKCVGLVESAGKRETEEDCKESQQIGLQPGVMNGRLD